MNALLVTCTAAVALAVGSSGVNLKPTSGVMRDDTALSIAAHDSIPSSLQQKGRYKKQGDNCVWAATDGGPNQCTPITPGRFKKGANDACTWDANDTGADQCKPAHGRWKKGNGDDCTWDANDSGPNQCNPRKAKATK